MANYPEIEINHLELAMRSRMDVQDAEALDKVLEYLRETQTAFKERDNYRAMAESFAQKLTALKLVVEGVIR